ncbi:trans-aconitate 2-methyltransferase [Sphingomonas sp. 28-63-12]|uniref:class I SAM-dependent methyltransferase n=1 Tax=Sphingomonas sp. 28-63-12 TaxID=1970434 RepID=UPI0035A932FE
MSDLIAAFYERNSAKFDSDRRKSFTERAWLDRFLQPLPKGGRILDLGCGAGEPVTRHLIDRGFMVSGVDISPKMVGLCRTRFPRHRWINADMRRVAMDGFYDGVLAWDSLFHLRGDEQAALIERIGAWLAPGGRALFNTSPIKGTETGTFQGQPLFHAGLEPHEYREAFARAEVAEIDYRPDDPGCGGRSIWYVRKA